MASLEYGSVGVTAADIDVDRASRLLALRWAPERNFMVADAEGNSPIADRPGGPA
jgi:hypothetical protein